MDTSKSRMQVHSEAQNLITDEQMRQIALKAQGRFRHTPFDVGMQEPEKLAAIMEEVGEIARNVMARSYLVTDGERENDALLKEVVQLCALGQCWIERLLTDEGHRVRSGTDASICGAPSFASVSAIARAYRPDNK